MVSSQSFKMISKVELFLCPAKHVSSEEGQRIQRQKCYITTNNNKDEDNSPKNHNTKYTSSLISEIESDKINLCENQR